MALLQKMVVGRRKMALLECCLFPTMPSGVSGYAVVLMAHSSSSSSYVVILKEKKEEKGLRKCSFFEWKDEEQADGYYKNLLYSLKQKLDAKEELSEMNKMRRRIVEVEFLLS
ncbi:unnamed protein product [Lactuca saligna]|uniref:Uncharacterized protein n=1 Tax=Lactuca saligna TaxID=75948 RepID=A0AA35V2E5_LACSI|nr:unnamed protein product [Lactuca saligna]